MLRSPIRLRSDQRWKCSVFKSWAPGLVGWVAKSSSYPVRCQGTILRWMSFQNCFSLPFTCTRTLPVTTQQWLTSKVTITHLRGAMRNLHLGGERRLCFDDTIVIYHVRRTDLKCRMERRKLVNLSFITMKRELFCDVSQRFDSALVKGTLVLMLHLMNS